MDLHIILMIIIIIALIYYISVFTIMSYIILKKELNHKIIKK